jgi:uncharacterized membrane protein YeaQ/YmgE (transglycosylase-associated protein family)
MERVLAGALMWESNILIDGNLRIVVQSGADHNTNLKGSSMHGILWWIIVGLIAGFLTGKVMKGSGFGVIGDIIIGILGALVGGFLFSHLGLAGSGGLLYSILVAFLGAVILTWLFRLITGNRA